jgi:hypothetical protein
MNILGQKKGPAKAEPEVYIGLCPPSPRCGFGVTPSRGLAAPKLTRQA